MNDVGTYDLYVARVQRVLGTGVMLEHGDFQDLHVSLDCPTIIVNIAGHVDIQIAARLRQFAQRIEQMAKNVEDAELETLGEFTEKLRETYDYDYRQQQQKRRAKQERRERRKARKQRRSAA
ncbi:MAG TPA: hypothetical protein VG713_03995 [Pirellulales bacterium]|nr:hypothetical protein [Pirellulales bacterium]